ncbi:MAG TPA: MMPL family transporter, partial [Actinomycetales bacterium]|nr:MMPL family transporter [Actinomycetales bacterium]
MNGHGAPVVHSGDGGSGPAGRRTAGHGRPRTLRLLLPAVLVLVWLAVGGLTGPFAGQLSGVATNDSAAFLPATAESTRALAEQRSFSATQEIPAVIVAARESGITDADRAFLASALSRIKTLPDVSATAVSPPIPSEDGKAVEAFVPIADSGGAKAVVSQVRDVLAGAPPGLEVLVTGPAGLVADLVTAFAGIDGLLLIVAAAVVALILVVVYRSVLLPLVVLVSAVFALGLASFAVYLLADAGVLQLNGQSQGILFILVFGAATDYALLLVSRFREQLRDEDDRVAALWMSWRGTIAPISASASTVVLGVLCLLFSELNSNRGLGPVAAIGIVSAWLASMTFLPAVLALMGRAAFWPLRPALGSPHPERSGWWARLGERIGSRPRAVWALTGLALVVCAAFLPQLRAQGTSQTDVFLRPVDSVAGQELLSEHFPGGSGSPTVIVANAGEAEQVAAAAR